MAISPSSGLVRFGVFEIDLDSGELRKQGIKIKLHDQPFKVLGMLLERPGQVVTREELSQRLWPANTFVDSELGLNSAVMKLREALGDSADNPRFIETLPRRGYRFVAPVSVITAPAKVETPIADTVVQAEPAPPVRLPTPEMQQQTAVAEQQDLIPVNVRPAQQHAWRAAVWVVAGALVVAAAVAFLRRPPQPGAAPMSDPLPLTSYRGTVIGASFSPGADQIAFAWTGERQDNYDVYVKTVGSEAAPLRLTSDPAPDLAPAWSPDGRLIAFERLASNSAFDLMLVPALGGAERKLGEFPRWWDLAGFRPAWSLDSKWLIVPVATDAGGTLFRVSVETGEAIPILKPEPSLADTYPSLSPDGKTLLYVKSPVYYWGHLWTVHVDDDLNVIDAPRQIPGGELVRQGEWLENGKEILAVVSGTEAGVNQPGEWKTVSEAPGGAIRISASGNSTRLILPADTYIAEFEVSRRGDRLAYVVKQGDFNIWRVDLSAKLLHPEPLIASSVWESDPQYSPDGRKIAFQLDRIGKHMQLWVADADGKNERQLTFLKTGLAAAAHWSPDGQTITFDSNADGGILQIYRIPAEGGKVQQLTHGSYPSFNATWSRDGRWLYYVSRPTGRNELWKMPAGGGAAVQITHNGGMMGFESPDGKTIYFSKETGSGGIWEMPVDGGREVQLVDSLRLNSFAITKHGIYYATEPRAGWTSQPSQLMFYSFATKKSTLILPIGMPGFGVDVSPDGRYLVYNQIDNPSSNLMLIENFH